MYEALKVILEIQELDMQMIQLMRLKKEREAELQHLQQVKNDLKHQATIKEGEILELKKSIRYGEADLQDSIDKVKKLEALQNSVKKIEEFNALTHEMAQAEKEKHGKELRLSDLYDRLAAEEDVLKSIQESLAAKVESSRSIEEEVIRTIERINAEGKEIKLKRDALVSTAEPEVFQIYEKLLRNKKDRVVVPIENRCCSGCHIMITPQDENLVRKGERIVFCEYCSRIHYWQESEALEGTPAASKVRRRRPTRVTT